MKNASKNSPQAETTQFPPPPLENAPLLEKAVWNAKIGRISGAWKVFPCSPGQKRPLHQGWQTEATWDCKSVAAMWQNDPKANIGLAIQPCFVAIDCDLYKPGAEAALTAFENQYGELPRTLESNTPSGGIHLIYSTVKTFGNGKGTLPNFGDVRGYGGFIVGPGSTFKGKRYTVESLALPVPLPKHVEMMLSEAKATLGDARRNYGEPTQWDEEQAKRLVELVEQGKLIKRYDGAFIEGERDNLTFQLFAEAKNRMIHPDAMLEAVQASGIDGGLDEIVERKMRSAYHDGNTSGSYGSKVESFQHWKMFKPFVNGKPIERTIAELDPVVWKAAHPNLLPNAFRGDLDPTPEVSRDTGDVPGRYPELVQYFGNVLAASGERKPVGKFWRNVSDTPPLPWIIPGWMSRNSVWIMYGESGTFKTYMAINKALCIATGRPWGAYGDFKGYPTGKPRDVALFLGEDPDDVARRIRAAILGGRFDKELVGRHLVFVPTVYAINHADGLAGMANEIESLGARPAAIFVDTFNLALDGNEDASDEIKKAIHGLRSLAMMYEGAGVLIDHVGHRDGSRPRGSSAKRANADGMILCKGDETARHVELSQDKNRSDGKQQYRAKFNGRVIDLGDGGIPNLAFDAIQPEIGSSAASQLSCKDTEFALVLDLIAKAVTLQLKGNPSRSWSQSALADAIATHDQIEVGSSQLRQKYLTFLREDKARSVRHYYRADTRQWRYIEKVPAKGLSG